MEFTDTKAVKQAASKLTYFYDDRKHIEKIESLDA